MIIRKFGHGRRNLMNKCPRSLGFEVRVCQKAKADSINIFETFRTGHHLGD